MAFTRKFLADHGVPEENIDAIMAERGRSLTDYLLKTDVEAQYILKSDARTQLDAAVENAKKSISIPKAEETEEYKALKAEYDGFKARQDARTSEDFKGVKSKFFDSVYDKIDRSEGAKPIAEQIKAIKEEYAEFFDAADNNEPPAGPAFGDQTTGEMPKGYQEGSFAKAWGYKVRKDE